MTLLFSFVQHSEKIIKPIMLKEWLKNNDNVWLVDPKDNFYQWIKNVVRIFTIPRGTIHNR